MRAAAILSFASLLCACSNDGVSVFHASDVGFPILTACGYSSDWLGHLVDNKIEIKIGNQLYYDDGTSAYEADSYYFHLESTVIAVSSGVSSFGKTVLEPSDLASFDYSIRHFDSHHQLYTDYELSDFKHGFVYCLSDIIDSDFEGTLDFVFSFKYAGDEFTQTHRLAISGENKEYSVSKYEYF